MVKVLLGYASKNGSTAEIATFMGDILKYHELDVTVADVSTLEELGDYDVFVLGCPVYTGMWLPDMYKFIRRFTPEFNNKPIYCWMTCIRVLESDGLDHVMGNYVPHALLENLNVHQITAFAGKLKWAEVNWEDRWTLSVQYDGKKDARNFNADHRDWNAIHLWSVKLAQDIKLYHGLIGT